MNFLAHLAIAHLTNTSAAANLVADYFKGPADAINPITVRTGILMHRFVDSYAQQNEIIRSCIAFFPESVRKMAPILTDLFFDHFLAKDWNDYMPAISLDAFLDVAWKEIQYELPLFPPIVQDFLAVFLRERWIDHYDSVQGMVMIIHRLSRRRRFLAALREGAEIIRNDYPAFEIKARIFFPNLFMDAILFGQRLKKTINNSHSRNP